ncbi:MAG: DUF58 domain-containing protein [Candidatus Nanopelagicales bacterium]
MSAAARPGFSAAEVATRSEVLRRLEIEVTRRLDGLGSGPQATAHLGPGSERAGARRYDAGDDARTIDWNLTARSGEAHVRRTEDERTLDLWIVVDRSASLDFGTIGSEKRDVALAAVAAFGLEHLGGGNRVGVVVCGTDALVHRPPRTGKPAVMSALALVHSTPRAGGRPGRAADLASALRWVATSARRRSRVVVVSDFLDASAWDVGLRRLAMRHDVVAVQVTDPRELVMPDVGIVPVVDAESGRQRFVDTRDADLRRRYAEVAAARDAAVVSSVRGSGATHVRLSTDRDWLGDVVRFAMQHKGLRASSTSLSPRRTVTTTRG